MSSLNGILQQLDRVSSGTMSRSHKDKVCTSVTKEGGHAFDDSAPSIVELNAIQHKGALLWNESVENCSSGHVLRTKEDVMLNGTESFDGLGKKIDFLGGLEADLDVCATPNTDLEYEGHLDMSDLPVAKPQSMSPLKTSHVLHVTEQSSPSSHSCDGKDVARSASDHTSQFLSSVPCHTRSLSQTTSQLSCLIDRAECGSVGETSYVKNVFEGSHVMSGDCDSDTAQQILDKLHDTRGLRTVQVDVNWSDQSTGSDKEEIASESSPLFCAEVPQSSRLEPETEASTLTHSPYPDWKLDRRESGHLFWRRDSSTSNGIDPSNHVKFRYDIEVREFESRNSEVEDLVDDDEYDDTYVDDDGFYDDDDFDGDEAEVQGLIKRRVSDFKSPVGMTGDPPAALTSAALCVVAIAAIVVMASYGWLLSALSLV